jgi:hypothetical protein
MNELTIKEYYAIRRKIDKKDAERSRNFVRRVQMNGTADDLDWLRITLNQYRKNINKLREEALQNFAKSCQIDDSAWQGCIERFKAIIRSKKQNMRVFLNPLDAHLFPIDARLNIEKRLREKGISSGQVQLACGSGDEFFYGVTSSIDGCSMGCLTLNVDAWKNADFTKKDFACTCMVAELIEPLSILTQLVGYFWPFMIQTPALRYNIIKLQNRARVLSVLRISVRNAQNAYLAKKYALSMATSYFSPKDYAFISAVEWRWQALECIEESLF